MTSVTTTVTEERRKAIQRQYTRAADAVDEILTNALVETYEALTGNKASDRLQEAIHDAIRFNT